MDKVLNYVSSKYPVNSISIEEYLGTQPCTQKLQFKKRILFLIFKVSFANNLVSYDSQISCGHLKKGIIKK